MVIETESPVEERVASLLQRLGVSKAHFAGRTAGDWSGLAESRPEVISSLTLVCPLGFAPKILASIAPRLLVFSGDKGAPAEMVRRNLADLPDATMITLPGYRSPDTYADIAVDRTDGISLGMLEFLNRMGRRDETAPVALPEGQGDVAGISYQVQGSGPPLVLFPLGAAPSQWTPLLPRLSSAFCAIVLGGAQLGMIANLEGRGRSPGYLGAVGSLMDEAQLQPGETVLEVGCGTGVLDRWLARRTGGCNSIVGVDVNRFFLREAAALANKEGLENLIEFREGTAEALPFPDGSFDVTMSSTVIQRVNADRMLAEMVRVTRPGGRVAVLGHAHDMPRWVNLSLSPALKAKVESPPWPNNPGHEQGCNDATLYRRFHQAGLSQVKIFPHMCTFSDGPRLQFLLTSILPTLSPEEVEEWGSAVTRAEAEGTFFIATPFHCAIGTKP